jgi:SAM-dependent methyltransferase
MYISDHTDTLIRGIKAVQRDPNLELEALIKNSPDYKITQESFNKVIGALKGSDKISLHSTGETMDILLPDNNDDLRYTIHGNQAINLYCKTNNLSGLKNGTYSLMKKSRLQAHKPIDINNYNIRVNIKKEVSQKINLEVFNEWPKMNKIFRYKKRFSFITEDKLFQFDLTVLKTSNKNVINLPNKTKLKKEVSEQQRRFVVKPANITNFNEWWSKLKPNDEVELKGKRVENYVHSKTLQQSNALKNIMEYEIELEYLGNKINYVAKYETILDKFVENIGILLQAIQDNPFIISQKEKSHVRDEYKALMGATRFMGPQPTTLELKHVTRKNYSDYNSILSIRRNYCVTDKADGERNLLMIMKDGQCYLINRKNEIKSLGCKLPDHGNSIIDGEYIKTDKDGKNILLFAAFDLYFYKGEDFRSRVLNRSDIETDKAQQSRYEKLKDMFEDIVIVPDDKTNPIMVTRKKFYFGDMVEYSSEIDKNIMDLESELLGADDTTNLYEDIVDRVDNMKSDMKIFTEARKVYSRDYIYKIDGLIFTPINLPIGGSYDYGKKPKFDGRWFSCFKWKPPEENTIDFQIMYRKDPEHPEADLIRYVTRNDEAVAYKTVVLNVGYNPETHTNVNSCRVLNEELTFKEGYHSVPFQPYNPYIKNIELAYIPLKNGVSLCDNKSIILDGSIVEFSYNADLGEGFCWKPMRVRNVVTPNDFVTAINNWRTLHNPITSTMIASGDIPDMDEVYYFKTKERKELPTKPLADFHSFIKKKLITKHCKKTKSLLDLCGGKGGDLNHWLDCKLDHIVSLDINRDNLENSNNGACNRVLNAMANTTDNNRLLKNILFLWADASKELTYGDAAKDDLNQFYMDVIYGKIDKSLVENSKLIRFYGIGANKFDNISCQFSIHYFFENKEKLDNLLRNVSDNLKPGGKFIGTCLDGKKVFESLKDTNSMYEMDGDELLWKIIKKYDQDDIRNDDTSIGYPVEVFINSIGKTTMEWLVNFDYLKIAALEYDLEVETLTEFETMYKLMKKGNTSYGDASKMSDKLKRLSFMHSTFAFVKKNVD